MKVARIAGASRHSRLETEPMWYKAPSWITNRVEGWGETKKSPREREIGHLKEEGAGEGKGPNPLLFAHPRSARWRLIKTWALLSVVFGY